MPGRSEVVIDIVRAHSDMADALTAIAWEAKQYWGYPDSWREAWREELTIPPSMIEQSDTWTAEISRKVVGFYVLIAGENRMGSLEHLWVLPDASGKGIGRRLLHHAVDRAKSLGLAAISVTADPNAEAFYRKQGARRIGTEIGSVCGAVRELPVLVISSP